ncbi:MAG TPA: efflux RND transporter periplasmic adaptor subunit [Smithella sp.]|nr:efflux RND transporter periplasmic adaptor subunit [Smithella sp.]
MEKDTEIEHQKPKSRRKRARWLGIGLLVLIAFLWLSFSRHGKPPQTSAKPPAITVETASVFRADLPQYFEGLGTVQAYNNVAITARVDGQLQEVLFKEGQMVRKGDVLARIDPRPFQAALNLARAAKSKDEAQLENAKHDLARYVYLAPNNLASKQTVDTQQALVKQLEAQIKADQATIDNAQTQLDYTTLKSPIDGRIGIRTIDIGNNVHSGDTTPIVTVTQMQPISLVFTLPEEALPRINQSFKGTVVIEALSRDNKVVLGKGTLLLVDNQIDQTTGTIKLKATFPNANAALWPGQFVNARLLLPTRHNVLAIPSAAAQRGSHGLFSYVVRPDSTVEMRLLKTDSEVNGTIPVESGLKDGERVVTSNFFRLQPGTLVQIIPNDSGKGSSPISTKGPAR